MSNVTHSRENEETVGAGASMAGLVFAIALKQQEAAMAWFAVFDRDPRVLPSDR